MIAEQRSARVHSAILKGILRRHCGAFAQSCFVHQASGGGNDCWPINDRCQTCSTFNEEVSPATPCADVRGAPAQAWKRDDCLRVKGMVASERRQV
jgi:hypothetical protein